MKFLKIKPIQHLSTFVYMTCIQATLFLTVVSGSTSCPPGYNPNVEPCTRCHDGTYRKAGMSECYNHTDCEGSYNRMVLKYGDTMKDNVCGNCLIHFVDEEGNDGDGSITSICIACKNAKPETRNRYAKEWCDPMVPMGTFQETKSKLQKSQKESIGLGVGLGVLFFVFILAGLIVGVYFGACRRKLPQQENGIP